MLPLDLYVDLLSVDPDLQRTQPYDYAMPMDSMEQDQVDQPQGANTIHIYRMPMKMMMMTMKMIMLMMKMMVMSMLKMMMVILTFI